MQKGEYKNGIDLLQVGRLKKAYRTIRVKDLRHLIKAKRQLDRLKTYALLTMIALAVMVFGFLVGNGILWLVLA